MFVVVPFTSGDLAKTLLSIDAQKLTPRQVIIVGRYHPAIDRYRDRWTFLESNASMAHLIDQGLASLKANPDDICVIVRGGDWLAGPSAFSIFSKVYKDPNIQLTYGQFVEGSSGKLGQTKRVRSRVKRNRSFCKKKWIYGPPYTFRYRVWKNADWEDEWVFSLLKEAGMGVKYLTSITYVRGEATHFKIVVPSYNSAKWLDQTLSSIENQSYSNYQVCVVDDASTEPKQKEIIKTFCKRNGWLSIFHQTNQKQLSSAVHAIEALECENEDVVIILDGDDWLFHSRVLETLHEIYAREHVWLTYGEFVSYTSRTTCFSRKITWWEHFRRSYRKGGWRFCHLHTFKAFLWNRIKDDDLRDEDGNYLTSCCDVAVIYPMLEMAGPKSRYVPQILVEYNDVNPLQVEKIREKEQKRNYEMLCQKPKYQRLR